MYYHEHNTEKIYLFPFIFSTSWKLSFNEGIFSIIMCTSVCKHVPKGTIGKQIEYRI